MNEEYKMDNSKLKYIYYGGSGATTRCVATPTPHWVRRLGQEGKQAHSLVHSNTADFARSNSVPGYTKPEPARFSKLHSQTEATHLPTQLQANSKSVSGPGFWQSCSNRNGAWYLSSESFWSSQFASICIWVFVLDPWVWKEQILGEWCLSHLVAAKTVGKQLLSQVSVLFSVVISDLSTSSYKHAVGSILSWPSCLSFARFEYIFLPIFSTAKFARIFRARNGT